MSHAEAARRLMPRIWHTDWLMLRGLGNAIAAQLERSIAPGARLLDFGCGSMPYRSLVEQRGAAYIGADFDAVDAVAIRPDGSLPINDASVDVVLSVQVLEHVRDLDRYLAEARRVLKDEGLLLLSTHGTWLYHPHPEDHRRWTRTGLIADIEARGFRVEEVEAIAGPLATTTLIRLAGYAFFLRRLPVLGAPLANLLSIVMNIRASLEDRVTPAGLRRDNGCIYMTRCVKVAE
jgi:SAM-dependent methyltransferase